MSAVNLRRSALVLLLAAVALHACLPGKFKLVEACIYLGLLLFVASQQPIKAMLQGLKATQRAFVCGIVALMFSCQLIAEPKDTFPFTAWYMFTWSTPGDAQYFEYTAVLRSGQEVPLPIPREACDNTNWTLARMARDLERATAGRRPLLAARYDLTLRHLGQKYSQRHPADPVQRIHVTQCTIPVAEYQGRASIARRPFRETTIE